MAGSLIYRRLVLTGVGSAAKVWIQWLNRLRVVNRDRLGACVDQCCGKAGTPLITVSNHRSTVDDPLFVGEQISGLLSWRQILLNSDRVRWTLAAQELIYTRYIYSWFFSRGRCVPVIRGHGVYQQAVDFCLDRLRNQREWVHVFPEGKCMEEPEEAPRLKWGVGRLVWDCDPVPTVLPFWHVGMNEVLPPFGKPYVPRIAKRVTILVGEPLPMENIVSELRQSKMNAREARRMITAEIQKAMYELRKSALQIHSMGS